MGPGDGDIQPKDEEMEEHDWLDFFEAFMAYIYLIIRKDGSNKS